MVQPAAPVGYTAVMFTKHFFKMVTTFTVIIAIGIIFALIVDGGL